MKLLINCNGSSDCSYGQAGCSGCNIAQGYTWTLQACCLVIHVHHVYGQDLSFYSSLIMLTRILCRCENWETTIVSLEDHRRKCGCSSYNTSKRWHLLLIRYMLLFQKIYPSVDGKRQQDPSQIYHRQGRHNLHLNQSLPTIRQSFHSDTKHIINI